MSVAKRAPIIAEALLAHFPGTIYDERFDAATEAMRLAEQARKTGDILPIEEKTMLWHAIRMLHVGGSEIAALYNEQRPFAQSHFTLWQAKAGKIPPPTVEQEGRVKWGIYLEPHIAAWAADEFGWKIKKGGYVIDRQQRGMACSLDYVIEEPSPAEREHGFTGPGVLQIKNSDLIEHSRSWMGDEPPLWIILQLQHEAACAGFDWGFIVCLVGGNQLKRYGYKARPAVSDDLRRRVESFWTSVDEGKPPKVDGSDSTYEALKVLLPPHENRLPFDLSGDNEIETICVGFDTSRADRMQAEKHEQEWKNRLIEKMQGHTYGVCNGYDIRGSVTADNPGRPAKPGEIIGKRKGSVRWAVKERVAVK
jgi:predicted phage-related endonuclease